MTTVGRHHRVHYNQTVISTGRLPAHYVTVLSHFPRQARHGVRGGIESGDTETAVNALEAPTGWEIAVSPRARMILNLRQCWLSVPLTL